MMRRLFLWLAMFRGRAHSNMFKNLQKRPNNIGIPILIGQL